MKIIFLGTKANIKKKNELHQKHSSILLTNSQCNLLVDCGNDWLDELFKINPTSVVLTHAHPDHAWGLQNGAPCPVYATQDTWNIIHHYPIDKRITIPMGNECDIEKMKFKAFPVEHSTRCPAVCLKINTGEKTILYAPDLISILDQEEAFEDVDIYIGDGSSITKSIVRKIDDHLVGHTSIKTQMNWCKKFNVPSMYLTHCGSQILKSDHDEVQNQINEWAEERDLFCQIAYDGLEFEI